MNFVIWRGWRQEIHASAEKDGAAPGSCGGEYWEHPFGMGIQHLVIPLELLEAGVSLLPREAAGGHGSLGITGASPRKHSRRARTSPAPLFLN